MSAASSSPSTSDKGLKEKVSLRNQHLLQSLCHSALWNGWRSPLIGGIITICHLSRRQGMMRLGWSLQGDSGYHTTRPPLGRWPRLDKVRKPCSQPRNWNQVDSVSLYVHIKITLMHSIDTCKSAWLRHRLIYPIHVSNPTPT